MQEGATLRSKLRMRSTAAPMPGDPSWSPHRGNNNRKMGHNVAAWEHVTGYGAMPVGAPDEYVETKKSGDSNWLMYGAIAAVVLYLYNRG